MSFIHRLIAAQERALGVSLDYLRDIADASRSAFVKFCLFGPLASHRKVLPLEAFHLARLVATQTEDCGTCVQIVVNMARKEGVLPEFLKGALSGNDSALPPELADVVQFSRLVAEGNDDEVLRDKLRQRYGAEGLVEISLAIATARVFPTIKRGLGHARSCSLVSVEI